jgi:glycosyltransferase involved in cell wall biosynthesis
MRILVAHNVSAKSPGGMMRIMTFIHDRIVAQGHTVEYFCSEDVPAKYSPRARRFGFPVLVWQRARLAAREGAVYDIVNVHEPSGAAMCMAKRLAGNPKVVVTSHGVEQRGIELSVEEAQLGRIGSSARSRMVQRATTLWQTRLSLRLADHVFCLNGEDREYLAERLQVDRRRVTRICPGVDGIYASASAARGSRPARRLLFAASWRKNKGIEDFVPAFTQLARCHAELSLTIVGGGLAEERIKADFPAEIRPRVSCVHTRGDAENARIFAECDVFVLPSLFEGTPLTLMEAMGSGLPIVTTATCGMKDVIEHGRNGLLVPMRSPERLVSAVESLLANGELRRELGAEAAKDAVERYTWDHSAATVLRAYKEIMGGEVAGSEAPGGITSSGLGRGTVASD